MSFDAFSDNYGFNTQPPEGGWDIFKASDGLYLSFNTQPPEGGWLFDSNTFHSDHQVSTHSRLKAAGINLLEKEFKHGVSTHSRLKAAGESAGHPHLFQYRFNTQPPEGGWSIKSVNQRTVYGFQHTAA